MAPRLDEASRRAIVDADRAWIGRPFRFGGDPRAIQANTRHMALMLADTTAADRASRMAAFASDLLDVSMAASLAGSVACARGCSRCCTTFVSATIPEVLRLARALKATPARAARTTKVGALARAIPQAEREKNRIVCPVLEDHACAEYGARPVVCRYVTSKSLDACVRIFTRNSGEAMPYAEGSTGIRSTVAVMMKAAMAVAGLPGQHVELSHGLAVALAADDAEAQWLAGEPLFDAVAVDRVDQESAHLKGLVNALAGAIRPTV